MLCCGVACVADCTTCVGRVWRPGRWRRLPRRGRPGSEGSTPPTRSSHAPLAGCSPCGAGAQHRRSTASLHSSMCAAAAVLDCEVGGALCEDRTEPWRAWVVGSAIRTLQASPDVAISAVRGHGAAAEAARHTMTRCRAALLYVRNTRAAGLRAPQLHKWQRTTQPSARPLRLLHSDDASSTRQVHLVESRVVEDVAKRHDDRALVGHLRPEVLELGLEVLHLDLLTQHLHAHDQR